MYGLASTRYNANFGLWGRLQSAEGFSPTPSSHEKPPTGGLKVRRSLNLKASSKRCALYLSGDHSGVMSFH
jgi:hypothetical protein